MAPSSHFLILGADVQPWMKRGVALNPKLHERQVGFAVKHYFMNSIRIIPTYKLEAWKRRPPRSNMTTSAPTWSLKLIRVKTNWPYSLEGYGRPNFASLRPTRKQVTSIRQIFYVVIKCNQFNQPPCYVRTSRCRETVAAILPNKSKTESSIVAIDSVTIAVAILDVTNNIEMYGTWHCFDHIRNLRRFHRHGSCWQLKPVHSHHTYQQIGLIESSRVFLC